MRFRSAFLVFCAVFLSACIQASQPTRSTEETDCLQAQAPSGASVVIRSCNPDSLVAGFEIDTGKDILPAVAQESPSGSLAVPLPFDPRDGLFLVFKRNITLPGKSWQEYGVLVFAGQLVVRSIVDCPNNDLFGFSAGPSWTSLTCPTSSGKFVEDFETPANYTRTSWPGQIQGGVAVVKVGPSLEASGPSKKFLFHYESLHGSHDTTNLFTNQTGAIICLEG